MSPLAEYTQAKTHGDRWENTHAHCTWIFKYNSPERKDFANDLSFYSSLIYPHWNSSWNHLPFCCSCNAFNFEMLNISGNNYC